MADYLKKNFFIWIAGYWDLLRLKITSDISKTANNKKKNKNNNNNSKEKGGRLDNSKLKFR